MRPWLTVLVLSICASLLFVAACSRAGAGRGRPAPQWALTLSPGEGHASVSPDDAAPHEGAPRERARTSAGVYPPAAQGDAPAQPEELRFAVVSDLNGRYGSVEYAAEVHDSVRWLIDEVQPELVLSTGDMVAGQRAGLDYQAMWAGFHAAVSDPLAAAGIPLAVTPGNHDASAGDAFLGERITYTSQWRRRRPDVEFVDDRFYPLHYAFFMKGVLFVSLDATMVGPLDPAQVRWLREVLQANQHARAKVVFGHIPLYPVTQGREREILNDARLEALLNEFGVDLMFSGHHHAYYPGRRGALRLVHMACLGSGPRKLVGSDARSPKSLVVVRVAPDGEVSVDAFDSTTFQKVPREGLPEFLNDAPWRIWRDDVDPRG